MKNVLKKHLSIVFISAILLCGCRDEGLKLNSHAPGLDFPLQELFSPKNVKLSDFKGQVVFVDFWASWCPPCQKPMAENQRLVEEHAQDWKDKAVIVCVSIDDEKATVEDHVKANGWQSPVQLWAQGGWNSPIAKAFDIKGVPSAFLLNRDGLVVWQGHPAQIDVESKIQELLK